MPNNTRHAISSEYCNIVNSPIATGKHISPEKTDTGISLSPENTLATMPKKAPSFTAGLSRRFSNKLYAWKGGEM
jgi:hypothetical protein